MKISVLLPTRGRPEHLFRALQSLSTGDAEIIIGADSDDPALTEYGKLNAMSGRQCRKWLVHESFPTLAQKVNNLLSLATGDVIFQMVNDMVVTEPDWCDRIRQAVSDNPDPTIFYSFVGHDERKASLPILRRAMVEDLGWFCPPHYPFWWSDSHFTEIVRMSGKGCGIDLGVQHQEGVGGTQGIRDIAFWHRFFELTRAERIAYAEKLRGEPVPAHLIEECEVLSSMNPNPATYEHYERQAERIPMPRYHLARAEAEAHLKRLQKTQKP